jgi:hypothetical protein
MRGELITDNGLSAASIIALATLLGVHRNRIAEWRSAGGPADLELASWAGWLQRTGRSVLASRCRHAVMETPDALTDDKSTPDAPMDAPAAQDDTGLDVDSWKTREARARALRAEIALDQERRDAELASRKLISADDCRGLLSRFAASTNDVIGKGIWNELLPALAGAPVDLVARLRKAHADAVLDMRGRISSAAREVASSINSEKP